MRFNPVLIIFFLASFFSIDSIFAKNNEEAATLEGTEFWICFQQNFKHSIRDTNNKLILELVIISSDSSNILIENEKFGLKKKVSLKPNTVERVRIEPEFEIHDIAKPQKLAIHISSDNPIKVYCISSRPMTSDTYTAIPVSSLGTEYIIISRPNKDEILSECAIAACLDSTSITIIPSTLLMNVKMKIYDKEFKIILNKGEVYQLAALFAYKNPIERYFENDLSGTIIKADKKIAVFSGHQCANIPYDIPGCNHLAEQLFPINRWGQRFFIGQLARRSKSSIRIIAAEDETIININSKKATELVAGEIYDRNDQSEAWFIESNKPIITAQFSQGFKNGDSIGDPMMLLINPERNFKKNYIFAAPLNDDWENYINIIVPADEIGTLSLDNKPLDKSLFKECGKSAYLIAQIKVKPGFHHIKCAQPFGLYSYGFNTIEKSYDAYGNIE